MGWNATFSMAVGGMIGGGIFSVLGVVPRCGSPDHGPPWRHLACWVGFGWRGRRERVGRLDVLVHLRVVGDGTGGAGGGEDGPRNAYLVALDGAGGLRFSADVVGNSVASVATKGARIGVSARAYTPFPWISTQLYDTGGTLLRNWIEQGFGLGKNGEAGTVAMTSSGMVILNVQSAPFYIADRVFWPMLIAHKP